MRLTRGSGHGRGLIDRLQHAAYASGMGEDKLGSERPPSPRELATAYGILQGQSTAAAMRAAGYSANTADVKAGKVEARLRALGLLPTPQDARDVVTMMRAVLVDEDDGAALKQAFRTMLARAQAGDVGALRFIMDYLVGKPTQRIESPQALTQTNVTIDLRDELDQRTARVLAIMENARERMASENGAAETPP